MLHISYNVLRSYEHKIFIRRKKTPRKKNALEIVTCYRKSPQVAQARYMSSSMLTFALFRDSICIFIKICMGKEINPKKNEKLPLNYNKNRSPEFQRRFLCVLCDFLTDLERFSVV